MSSSLRSTSRPREALLAALASPATIGRYRALVYDQPTAQGCLVWMGAVSGQGHGRFWLGRGSVTVAHRFGFAVAFGVDALYSAPQISHVCDESWCQNHEHLKPATGWRNTTDWIERRDTIGSPLRDVRGARGRALALRDAARRGESLDAAMRAGLPEVDRFQHPLW